MAADMSDGSRASRRRGSHFERAPRPRMSDLSSQPVQVHHATAESEVLVSQELLSAIIDGAVPRGDVLAVSELAGVMAGKRAHELIPLVHPVTLTDLVVTAVPERATGAVHIRAEATAITPGGVEMEALTAAAVAALTLYDMVRDVEPAAEIQGVRVVSSSTEGAAWQRPGGGEPRRRAPNAARMAGRIGGGESGNRSGYPRRPGGR